jgi:hypothetical protein
MTDSTPDSRLPSSEHSDSGSYLDPLINGYFDGLFTDDSMREFEAAMQESAAARQRFWELAVVHAASRDAARMVWGDAERVHAADGLSAAPADTEGRDRAISRVGIRRLVAAVLVSLGVMGMSALLWSVGGPMGLWPSVRASLGIPESAIAEISRTRYATEAGSTEPLAAGRRIGRQRLAVASGVVEIAVRNGVVLVVEGDAEIEVVSENLAFLTRGTAVVRLPRGLPGFVLETPTVTIDARGGQRDGEFAVRVDALTTDVQVYSGDVVASATATAGNGRFPRRIGEGTAIRFAAAGDSEPAAISFDQRRFVRRLTPEPGRGFHMEGHERPPDVNFGTPAIASIDITRATGPVVIDGKLDEWNPEGFFRRRRRDEPDDDDWIEGRMMYDDRNLYIGARVGDPAPMRNCVNPDLDPRRIWHGGALQVFLSVDRDMGWPADGSIPNYYRDRRLVAGLADIQKSENPKLMTAIMWHQATIGKSRLLVEKQIAGGEVVFDPEGAEGVFVETADGKGYTLEYAIPWTVLGAEDDPPRSGDTLAAAWELHLSDATGRIWRNQIVEIRNPAEPRGIYLYERATTWGRADYR